MLIDLSIAKGQSSAPRPLPAGPSENDNTVEVESAQTSPPVLSDWDNGSLQPAGLFNSQTARSGFSLGSILNASEPPSERAVSEVSNTSTDDPVRLGLVNCSIALSLFEE